MRRLARILPSALGVLCLDVAASSAAAQPRPPDACVVLPPGAPQGTQARGGFQGSLAMCQANWLSAPANDPNAGQWLWVAVYDGAAGARAALNALQSKGVADRRNPDDVYSFREEAGGPGDIAVRANPPEGPIVYFVRRCFLVSGALYLDSGSVSQLQRNLSRMDADLQRLPCPGESAPILTEDAPKPGGVTAAGPAPDSGKPLGALDAERAFRDALAGTDITRLSEDIQRRLPIARANEATEEGMKALSAVAASTRGTVPFAFFSVAYMGALKDASGRNLFPAVQAMVPVLAKLAAKAATDPDAKTAMLRLTAFLVRLDLDRPQTAQVPQ